MAVKVSLSRERERVINQSKRSKLGEEEEIKRIFKWLERRQFKLQMQSVTRNRKLVVQQLRNISNFNLLNWVSFCSSHLNVSIYTLCSICVFTLKLIWWDSITLKSKNRTSRSQEIFLHFAQLQIDLESWWKKFNSCQRLWIGKKVSVQKIYLAISSSISVV